jgi:hypothetical protein
MIKYIVWGPVQVHGSNQHWKPNYNMWKGKKDVQHHLLYGGINTTEMLNEYLEKLEVKFDGRRRQYTIYKNMYTDMEIVDHREFI